MPERFSNEAVLKATNKSWAEWFGLIDKVDGKNLSHKDIIVIVKKKGLKNSWWQQAVTNEYEKYIGRRVLGDSKTQGHEYGIRKTFNLTEKEAWSFITSLQAAKIWLGDIDKVNFEKGAKLETKDGTKIEVSVNSGAHIKMKWELKAWKAPTVVQIRIIPTKSGTTISFHNEKLQSAKHREEVKERWEEIVKKLEMLSITL